ncbi:archaeosortase/exosortase family protein [Kiloniella sp. b19]|uniref:archaeosortase/exosortase family protein n=1 Tax=Kiloniella sp. GXU_MW_B19 TaxID=3141326 RepID=UPI0031DCAE14
MKQTEAFSPLTVIRHRDLFLLVLSFGLANAMLRPILESIEEFSFYSALWQGFGISFIVWFAVHVVYEQLLKSSSAPADTTSLAVSFLTLLLFLFPSSMMAWIGLGFYCFYYSFLIPALKDPDHRIFRNAVLIAMALSFRVPVSDILLKISADFFLRFDALATELLLQLYGLNTERKGNIVNIEGGHELLIMTGCASFTNISLSLLLWFTIVRSQNDYWKNSHYLFLGLLALVVFLINLVRLSLMTLSKEDYFFYHDGTGADIVDALIVVSSIVLAFACVFQTKREVHNAH